MKKIMIALLIAAPAFAQAEALSCQFDDQSVITGTLDASQTLTVETYTNSFGELVDLNLEDHDGNDVNNNPIAKDISRGGRLHYQLDALSDDPDYGDICDLYVAASIKKGSTVPANYGCAYFSRNESRGKNYVSGTCTLN
jgi:hypothetical protein